MFGELKVKFKSIMADRHGTLNKTKFLSWKSSFQIPCWKLILSVCLRRISMVPQIMMNCINCQAIRLLGSAEKMAFVVGWYFFEKWTELQTMGKSTKLSHRVNLAWNFCFQTKSILFGCYYYPLESLKYFSNYQDQLILEQLETANRLNKEVIVMGDFNINYLSTATNLNLKRAFNNLGLAQIIKTATRITKNSSTSIHLIFTNKAANVMNASSFPLSFGDLDVIGCVRKINTIKCDPRTIECCDYKHNHKNLCNDIRNINWKPIEEASDVSKVLKYFSTKVFEVWSFRLTCTNNTEKR